MSQSHLRQNKPSTTIAPGAASKGSGASASGSQAPFAGVTASGLQVKKVDYGKRHIRLDIEKLPAPQTTFAIYDASMPPYYDRSLAEMEKLRKQQKVDGESWGGAGDIHRLTRTCRF